MTAITATQVKELRQATNVGMMECKRALAESGGDLDQAIKLLRERGMVVAGRKADRVANEGLIAADVSAGGSLGVIIEVNCETDFVARNEIFQAFVEELLGDAKAFDGDLAEHSKDKLVARIAEIGENLVIRRNDRYELQGTGTVASYIHLGSKVGVLVEIGCDKETTVEASDFKDTVKDVTLQIVASSPAHLTRDDVPADVLQEEREIFAKQAEGKPENIVEKIVDGKIEKFFSQVCLVEQNFVKDPDQSVSKMLEAKGKSLDDTLTIRRFLRYQIGT